MNMKDLAQALKDAETAHARYEQQGLSKTKIQWPEFYARWLLANTPLGKSTCV